MTTDRDVAKVSIVGAGIQNAPGYAARMFGTLAEAGINIEMISTSEIRITCIIAEDRRGGRRPGAPPRLRPGAAGDGRRPGARWPGEPRPPPGEPTRPFVSRLERFTEVDSTQRVVAGWLADGIPEVAVAAADVQTQGRGRHGSGRGRRHRGPPCW